MEDLQSDPDASIPKAGALIAGSRRSPEYNPSTLMTPLGLEDVSSAIPLVSLAPKDLGSRVWPSSFHMKSRDDLLLATFTRSRMWRLSVLEKCNPSLVPYGSNGLVKMSCWEETCSI